MNGPSLGTSHSWIGLDIGGANIKIAHQDGAAFTLPFEVWKRPDELGAAIATAVATLPTSNSAAVTMTAELCDCYSTKAEGVNRVLNAVLSGIPGHSVVVWGLDGSFHSVAVARDQPQLVAAANWLALAQLAAGTIPDSRGLLIDVGSTTTDMIPLDRGRVKARGKTDTERLQTGELVYAGVRRTPVCALANELPFRGVDTGLAAEMFASTLDVYLMLGAIAPDPSDLSTADGRPATREAARDRLARMVGADRLGFSQDDAIAFAQAADNRLFERLVTAAERAAKLTIGRPAAAVVSGSGEFLARRVASRVIEPGGLIVSLRDAWGTVASSAGCACAIVKLAMDWAAGDSDLAPDRRTQLTREGDPA